MALKKPQETPERERDSLRRATETGQLEEGKIDSEVNVDALEMEEEG